MNHAVLAVGYDLTGETPYWIVKNSWGGDWGEAGYFNIELGRNMCGEYSSVVSSSAPCMLEPSNNSGVGPGVATCASYPIVPEATT